MLIRTHSTALSGTSPNLGEDYFWGWATMRWANLWRVAPRKTTLQNKKSSPKSGEDYSFLRGTLPRAVWSLGRGTKHRQTLVRLLLGHKIGLDELINISVHYGLDSRGLVTRAVVLDTPVVKDIGTYL